MEIEHAVIKELVVILNTYTLKKSILTKSLLFGILYFLFSTSLEYTDLLKVPYIILMQFLPGITFPISTVNYIKLKTTPIKVIAHIIFSVLIYYSNVWLYSYQSDFKLSPIFAGLLGSLLFLVMSKYILKLNTKWNVIIFSSLLSGIVFIPIVLFEGNGISIGLAILLWTILNGVIICKSDSADLQPR